MSAFNHFRDINLEYKFNSVILPEFFSFLNPINDKNTDSLIAVFRGIISNFNREDIRKKLEISQAVVDHKFNETYDTIKIIHDLPEKSRLNQNKVLELYSTPRYKYVQKLSLPTTISISVYQGNVTADNFIEAVNEYIYKYDHLKDRRAPLRSSEIAIKKVKKSIRLTRLPGCSYEEKQKELVSALNYLISIARQDYYNYLGVMDWANNIFHQLEAYQDIQKLANFSLEVKTKWEKQPKTMAIAYERKAKVSWKLFQTSSYSHQEFLDESRSYYATACKYDPLEILYPWGYWECLVELRKLKNEFKQKPSYEIRNVWNKVKELMDEDKSSSQRKKIQLPLVESACKIIKENTQDEWVVSQLKDFIQKYFPNQSI